RRGASAGSRRAGDPGGRGAVALEGSGGQGKGTAGPMTRIKICGISDVGAGMAALEAGADYLGFVFYPPSHRCLEVARAASGIERILLDTSVPGRYGGTGETYAWGDFRASVEDAFLAGGLTPGNVGEAIAAAHPWGVDVSSGVEENKLKRPELIRAFIEAV